MSRITASVILVFSVTLVCLCAPFSTPSVHANSQSIHTVLYALQSGTAAPSSSLVMDAAGNVYGTAPFGTNSAGGYGGIFKVDAAGNGTTLYYFTGQLDGGIPYGGLFLDGTGNLYGTASIGGAYGFGTVFKLDTAGNFTVLHSFAAGAVGDGSTPMASLIGDANGDLYGTTYSGGDYGSGTVFKVNSATGVETVLHSFSGGGEGAHPRGGVIRDALCNLYGTTQLGGDAGCSYAPFVGCGTVFKLATDGTFTVLHRFAGTDGNNPMASLVMDTAGNLYGTTLAGGDPSGCGFTCGTVFKLNVAGTFSLLHAFTGGQDGASVSAGLIRDSNGNLYGTTNHGGRTLTQYCEVFGGCGTVFKIDSRGHMSLTYIFKGRTDGAVPAGTLIQDAAGNLFGTTEVGGVIDGSCFGCGTVFKLTPAN